MDKATNSSALFLPPPTPSTNAVVEDIRGIKKPVPIPNGWVWFAWVLGAAALLALVWYGLKRWKRRSKKVSLEVFVPPHERARRKLQEALELLDQPKPFCTLVSDAVRLYLEERFSLRAPERTTEEFLLDLQTTQHLTRPQKDSLADFLSRCDLVKFAKFEPPATALQDIYQAALRLIEEYVGNSKSLFLLGHKAVQGEYFCESVSYQRFELPTQ
jgi:hypothetical protein